LCHSLVRLKHLSSMVNSQY